MCYEFFCEQFDAQDWTPLKQLSRAFKTLYANAFAGQHMLVVDDIGRITANKLVVMYGKLEALRDRANEALRRTLGEKLGMPSKSCQAGSSALPDEIARNPNRRAPK